ncbi:hypothetical protein VTI74DRAFT_11517 [Chaetomium olivicolor]
MVSLTGFLFMTFAVVVSAAPGCRPPVIPTLPKTGADELAAPPANLVLKKIAIGHGIQNYSCESITSTSKATGAVAVLYDATSLYPGTKRSGISQRDWESLPSRLLWNKPLPLNKLAGTKYGADPEKPFPDPADLRLQGMPTVKFLGHHFFDINSIPVFDLSAAGLKAIVGKTGNVNAPSRADKGILGTGAVQWLELADKGESQGLKLVYRVITAGGVQQACSVAGAGVQSVPYTTFYWFYG